MSECKRRTRAAKPAMLRLSKASTKVGETTGGPIASGMWWLAMLNCPVKLFYQHSETEFSGLDTLGKSNSAYPEISVTELQNIAVNRCRLAPSEVTVDLLLVSREKADGVNGDRSKLEVTRMSHG